MQPDVHALIILDVDFDLSFGGVVTFGIGPNDIVGGAGWDALGKFSLVVGIQLPLRVFLVGTANLYAHSIGRMIVGSINRAEDERIWFCGALPRRARRSSGQHCQTQKQQKLAPGAGLMSSHPLRPPLFPLPPLPPPPGLVPEDWL